MAKKQLSYAECDALITAPGTEFEMVTVMENGNPQRVWKHAPPDFRTFFEGSMKKWSDQVLTNEPVPEPAEYDARQDVTYGQALDNAYRLAAWLREKGVGKGDRVAVSGINSSAWLTSFVAVNLLGAVPVCLNSTLVKDAQIHCLSLTKPKVVLADQKDAQVLSPIRNELKAAGVGPLYSWDNLDHLPVDARVGFTSLDYATLKVNPQTVADVKAKKGCAVQPTDDALILFTSGTTSMPKGVMITQRQGMQHIHTASIPAARAALRAGAPIEMALGAHAPPPQPLNVLMPVPMFHVTGLLAVTVRVFFAGSKLVFQRRWSVKDAVKLCVDHKIDMLSGVPSIATAILQSGLLPTDFHFAALSYGGAAPAKRLACDVKDRFPTAFINHGWGMTEAAGLHIAISGQDYIDRPDAVGVAIPIGGMRIVDENRKEVPPNTLGVLHIRGGNLAKGYLDNPKANAEAYTSDGWFDTGDVGIMNDDGILYLRDRAKDMIIRGGENIASAEVENAITQDPRVAEAAAVPVPDPVLGELVAVGVSLAPGVTATPESIIDEADKRLRYPARPVFVVLWDGDLPHNANGKFQKNEIKELVQRKWKEQGGKRIGPVKARL
ncbi:hypothetical protein CspHIS471_0602570 [Cutaneotrichosporon sp. HIS471]|nr:hypothetical protein CspHIS471_0602570 [Cutaneotrichosporon sp. HIS471]